jgi:hypothetical protein
MGRNIFSDGDENAIGVPIICCVELTLIPGPIVDSAVAVKPVAVVLGTLVGDFVTDSPGPHETRFPNRKTEETEMRKNRAFIRLLQGARNFLIGRGIMDLAAMPTPQEVSQLQLDN